MSESTTVPNGYDTELLESIRRSVDAAGAARVRAYEAAQRARQAVADAHRTARTYGLPYRHAQRLERAGAAS